MYIKAETTDALKGLHLLVKQALRDVGIVMPRERFRPHVTLARFRRDMPADDMVHIGTFLAAEGNTTAPPFEVSKIHLIGSTLRPDGAVHDVLATYPA